MRMVMFGAGGVGGYFGGRLAQAGFDLTFIARGRHLAAMQTQGLSVESINGDFVVPAIQATTDPAQVGPVDVVILAVKAWQVAEAAEAMRPLIGPETMVIPLQNGVEATAQLAAALGPAHVLGGFCRIVSFIAGPGHIRHTGGDAYLAFGELDNRRSERVERLYQRLSQAQGMIVEVPPDIQAAIWGKFLQISSWSGLGAVTRSPVGVWRSLPETRAMWQQAMREVFDLARARGVALDETLLEQVTDYLDKLPPHATASMQRDILEGRPSELEAQNGAVVRLGRESGVPTPVHTFIYSALLPLEKKARHEIKFPQDDER